jgi:arylsulfatase A-like enzyme
MGMSHRAKNILFIMCDQLRWDYLSCYGHPRLATPNIDKLATKGVRFTRAYVQSPVCGSSRMSFYTGRYVQSHGATWNGVPLKVGEMTLGDYLRPLGVDCVLVGKTHMRADQEGMERLGIDPNSIIGVRVAECGFDPYERDDGLHGVGPDGRYDSQVPRYNRWLNEKGYSGDNPWHDWANAAEGEGNRLASGWAMRHARKPARVAEADSETPYMTRRAMDFIEEAGDKPWCLHLSYIKPHWPYIAPAPYNAMYGASDVLPVIRSEEERRDPHPLLAEFMERRVGKAFAREEVREEVIPVYMGLIKQIDDQLGLLFRFMEDRGLLDKTLIVFTSDHGDYLGDHWMGEKDLFHEPSVKIPLIVYDPSDTADAARGTTCDELVESIDLIPTFLESLGADPGEQSHRLEGRSLVPFLNGSSTDRWRRFAISEYDYALQPFSAKLGIEPRDAQLFMVADKRWKLIHAPGFRPMLYDLASDPNEFRDLGTDPQFEAERQRLMAALNAWGLRLSQRTTLSEQQMRDRRGKSQRRGILIGVWDESDVPDELWSRYQGDTT